MRKRTILTIAAIVAMLALMIGGSVAYFSAEEKTQNVITTGGVDIELKEWADADKTTAFPTDGVDGVTPGTEITKIVEVTNTGASPAWIRVKAEKAIALAKADIQPDLTLVELDLNTRDWTEQDGWYYYNRILAPEETTVPLFTAVTFSNAMGNEYQNSTATVAVTAQAVQSANNGGSATEAVGWPAE